MCVTYSSAGQCPYVRCKQPVHHNSIFVEFARSSPWQLLFTLCSTHIPIQEQPGPFSNHQKQHNLHSDSPIPPLHRVQAVNSTAVLYFARLVGVSCLLVVSKSWASSVPAQVDSAAALQPRPQGLPWSAACRVSYDQRQQQQGCNLTRLSAWAPAGAQAILSSQTMGAWGSGPPAAGPATWLWRHRQR